ncbi:MAG: aldose 1-epimerase [Solirubrobacteraceae bacterium]
METVTLAAGGLEATFAPGAGMVCASLRHEGAELLASNGGLEAYVATGATMGIPLLHPWANRLGAWSYGALGREVDLTRAREVLPTDEHGLPIHGVLPGEWRIVAAGAASVSAELEFGPESPAYAAFPFPHRVALDAELRPGALRIETTVHAMDDSVPVAFGFHPYLTLPGAPRDRWRVRLPVRRHLVLDERLVPTGAEPVSPYEGPLAGHAFDDGFDCLAEPPAFAVQGGGRRLELELGDGFPVAQVFAPPAKDFVCFEPMTAPTDGLRTGAFPTASPGAPYAAAFTLSISTA